MTLDLRGVDSDVKSWSWRSRTRGATSVSWGLDQDVLLKCGMVSVGRMDAMYSREWETKSGGEAWRMVARILMVGWCFGIAISGRDGMGEEQTREKYISAYKDYRVYDWKTRHLLVTKTASIYHELSDPSSEMSETIAQQPDFPLLRARSSTYVIKRQLNLATIHT